MKQMEMVWLVLKWIVSNACKNSVTESRISGGKRIGC